MSSNQPCGCEIQPLPSGFTVGISGTTDGSCMFSCSDMNGSYTIPPNINDPCHVYEFQFNKQCGDLTVRLTLTKLASGLVKMDLELEINFVVEASYSKTNIQDWMDATQTLTGTPTGTTCTWPSSVTVTAEKVSLSELTQDSGSCLVPSGMQLVNIPFAGDVALGPDACDSEVPLPIEHTSPFLRTPAAGDCTVDGSACACPSGGNGGGGVAPMGALRESLARAAQVFPDWWPGPKIDLTTGSLQLRLGVPQSGSYDAAPFFTYNSRRAGKTSENGFGVTGVYSSKITEIDSSTVELLSGVGSVLRFTSKNASGVYNPPPGSPWKLVKNGDGTWTATLPDDCTAKYTSTGALDYVANATGNRWTISYSGGRVESIQSPQNRRVTINYDASNNLRSVVDPSGRRTTFTVNASGNLTERTTPELCTTELGYDGSHRLTSYVDPLGHRYTYSYDANGLVSSVRGPDNSLTTFTWVDGGTTKITDPKGNLTTVTYTPSRSVESVTNPLGQRTTYSWSWYQLAGMQDALGNQSTLAYEEDSTRRGLRLQALVEPLGGRVTFVYDGDGRLSAAVDQLGNRSTISWDASGRREALINPLGYRMTYSYTAT
jgi:YD repeat-containing protein